MCAVYVDDMYLYAMGRFRRMKMSHMIADTEAELHAFARRLGMRRAWYQRNHYDVSMGRRRRAIELGAIPITMRQLSHMVMQQRLAAVRNKQKKISGKPRRAV